MNDKTHWGYTLKASVGQIVFIHWDAYIPSNKASPCNLLFRLVGDRDQRV